MRIFLVLAAALLLGACSVVGEQRVQGWPRLQIVEHYVPNSEMRTRCSPYVPFYMSPEACAEFDFADARCDIWYSADFPPAAYVKRHEHEHCLGYDHVGEDDMRELLAQYRARR